MLDKALETNSTQAFKCWAAEPDFNPTAIERKIKELNKDIEDMQHGAFGHTGHYGTIITGGVDTNIIQSKMAIRDSLICHLESLKLLNK